MNRGDERDGYCIQKNIRPMPTADDLKIVTRTIKDRDGNPQTKRFAKWTDRKGKRHTVELVESGDRIKTEAATWTAKYRDGEGVVREVATGCRDKQAAQAVLKDLMTRAEKVKSKVLSPDEDRIADHQETPLADHIAAYVDHLRGRGVHPDRIKTMDTRMTQSAEGCGFRWLSDLNVDRLESWLGQLTEEPTDDETPEKPVSASIYNGHVESWVAFGFWCIGKRMSGKRSHMNGDKRLLVNPFEGMRRMNPKQDRRRIARALTEDELSRLLQAARRRPLLDAMTIRTDPNKGEPLAKVAEHRKPRWRYSVANGQ
jgi:hypothetical protein